MAFSHGRNDAQKPMGMLAMTLALYFRWSAVTVPWWVVISCAGVAALLTQVHRQPVVSRFIPGYEASPLLQPRHYEVWLAPAPR
jgi:hypothetical protein